MKPYTPAEAKEAAKRRKIENIPTFVVEAVNILLAQNLNNSGYAKIDQDEVIDQILSLDVEWALSDGHNPVPVDRQMIFSKKWLDFEAVFEEAGWTVSFDKPAYNEDYTAYWEFNAK